MIVKFTQVFGSHSQGSTADLPDQVAASLIRTGVAVEPSKAAPSPVLTNEVYKPKTTRKTISKAL